MPGKPGQSKLAPYAEQIQQLLQSGHSYRQIAAILAQRYHIELSHNAVYSFVRAQRRRHRFHRSFLAGLDQDIRDDLQRRLVAEWTHQSTALEGNTLTLGETFEVLQFGLTINGKPLRDHEEVYGHARAIDLLEKYTTVAKVDEAMLFDLHRAIMPQLAFDVMKPVGAWKRDYNGTTGVADGRPLYMEYSAPSHVPPLMRRWLVGFNERLDQANRQQAALDAYLWTHMTFVRIHPFFDGNGRLARLLANLPLLRCGHPPLSIAAEQRPAYIRVLWEYQLGIGRLEHAGELLPAHPVLDEARQFFATQWQRTISMVAEARQRQRQRGKLVS